jgi:hypothetical protein
MKKYLFWIYIVFLEINVIISVSFHFLFNYGNTLPAYNKLFIISTAIMFLFYEVFLLSSFFIDELALKRKAASIIFVVNCYILGEIVYFFSFSSWIAFFVFAPFYYLLTVLGFAR